MLPIITTTNTIIIPQQSAKTFDKLWIYGINATFGSFSDGGSAIITLRYYRVDENNIPEFAPLEYPMRQVSINNVFLSAQSNEKLGMAMYAICEAAQEQINNQDN